MLTPFFEEPIMIRCIRYVLLGLDFVIGSILGLLLGLIRPFNPTNSRWCAWFYSVLGLHMIGIKVENIVFENYPTDEGFIVVANHQSNWDLLVVGSTIPDRTVSLGKKSLKWVPLFGQLFWLAGNILIDRDNAKKAMEAMEITKVALTQKKTHIWFFAEGTRNHGKNMLPFKKGAFVTAMAGLFSVLWVAENGFPMSGGRVMLMESSVLDRNQNQDPIWQLDAPVDSGRWTGIVIHHLGRPAGDPESITRHALSQGAAPEGGMGYHFVIGNGAGFGNGVVHVARRWVNQMPGFHTAGPDGDLHNRRSIGICLVGDGDRRPFEDDQIKSLISLIHRLQEQLDLPPSSICLAYDLVPGETSPGGFFPSGQLMDEFPDLIRH